MACRPDNTPKTLKLSTQTQCTECKYEIQSMLRKVEGVYSISVDADRNTIIISGNLPPKALLEALLKVSQNGEFCSLPPAHIPPSSCSAIKPACGGCSCNVPTSAFPVKVCAPKYGCCPTPPNRCCTCTGASKYACNAACGGRRGYLPCFPGHGHC
uniref:HMA domain-containing protein n=1 Tax=Kalanchoe fedtschenkoi TaxID=63787 RepID=A0A7N0RGW3_KALFE